MGKGASLSSVGVSDSRKAQYNIRKVVGKIDIPKADSEGTEESLPKKSEVADGLVVPDFKSFPQLPESSYLREQVSSIPSNVIRTCDTRISGGTNSQSMSAPPVFEVLFVDRNISSAGRTGSMIKTIGLECHLYALSSRLLADGSTNSLRVLFFYMKRGYTSLALSEVLSYINSSGNLVPPTVAGDFGCPANPYSSNIEILHDEIYHYNEVSFRPKIVVDFEVNLNYRISTFNDSFSVDGSIGYCFIHDKESTAFDMGGTHIRHYFVDY